MATHGAQAGDGLIRLGGMLLLMLAALAGGALFTTPPGPDAVTSFQAASALALFAGISAGCAMLLLGRHLLVPVKVSSPWMSPRRSPHALERRLPRTA